jgi:hypothetical protein
MIFADQEFKVSGTPYTLSGKDVLVDVFGQKSDVDAWGMFGVLIAWVIFFRAVHYFLFLYASAPFMRKDDSSAVGSNKASKPAAADGQASSSSYEMVSQNQDPATTTADEGV